ncbi:hypothetical protein SpCBS45565_g01922 [Spizellomyces sp. 'palustris']|nr:hypothetical protein SpCBS45565_g01922 [Spizellomyces sp. 'palustris']
MGKKRNWFGGRSKLDLGEAPNTDIPNDPPAATPQGVAAASDLHAKRRIWINMPMQPPYIDEQTGRPAVWYKRNKIRTSKYTVISFLPKNIFEQFRSVANFYFTSLVILQCFPPFLQVSPVLTAAPIVIIVAATALKDAIEDWKRHRSDASVNKASTYLLSNWNNTNHVEHHAFNFNRTYKMVKRSIRQALRACFTAPFKARKPAGTETVGRPAMIVADDYMHDAQSDDDEPAVPNGTRASRTSSGHSVWKLSNWEDVRVGDFVFLRNDDPVPADIAILATSERDGLCYIETKNLDGETNLKVRRGIPDFESVRTPEDCHGIRAFLDSEPPTSNLYAYSGVLTIPGSSSSPTPSRASLSSQDSPKTVVPIGISGVLLRGCVLRNTKWVIGMAIFTGEDTKIMMNSGSTPSKRSRIDRQINPQVLVNFMLLSAMCMICAVIAAMYASTYIHEGAVFAGNATSDMETPSYTAFVTFFLCMIIFQNIIPIALVISVEVAKLFQSFMIHIDEEMYDAESDKRVTPQAWNLCDDLGQIEYIFSDKTGTLTCNTMEFRKCTINGVMYGGTFVSEAAMGAAERSGSELDARALANTRAEAEKQMIAGMKELFDTRYLAPKLSFVDADLPRHVRDNGVQARRIREFFTLLAVCHTVLVEKPDKSDENHLEYKAQSPDEAALVAAARDVGFAFLKRTDNRVEVDVMGQWRTYTILHVLEFNSDRKRMSVIIKRPEGDIILLCKGADSVIYDRLSKDNDPELMDVTSTHLENFANEGLRTLCLSYRIIPPELYERWAERYRAAQALIENRERECDLVAEGIERELILMGATAIEDKLQDGVPETISILAKAGIKIWVLTGDKMETAINIGFACNLLKRNMILIVVKSDSLDSTFQQLTEALERFWTADGRPSSATGEAEYAFIIDGESLKYALEPRCKALLLELGCRCRAVVCCRVSPLQKAMVVQLVRKGLGAMCLAIGDGANDVSMIQEADVGIGISGKEGLQAVMAADYAIGQFRFLGRLLLVHGRWAYLRTAEMVLNYFYKNVVYLFVLFWYQFDNGFSASTVTDYTYSMWFQTFFTLLPTIAIGTLDQDVNDRVSMMVPQLYLKGIRQTLYTMERFWLYIFDGIYQSVVIYFIAYAIFRDSIIYHQGWDASKDDMGTLCAMSIILTVNFYAALNIMNWTWMIALALVITICIWFGYLLFYISVPANPPYGQIQVLLPSGTFWLAVLLSVFLALFPRFLGKFVIGWFWPSDTDLVREVQQYCWKEGQELRLDEDGGKKHDAPAPEPKDEGSDSERGDVVRSSAGMRRNFSDNLLSRRRQSTSKGMTSSSGGESDGSMRRAQSGMLGSQEIAGIRPTPLPQPPLLVPASIDPAGHMLPGHHGVETPSDGFGDYAQTRHHKKRGLFVDTNGNRPSVGASSTVSDASEPGEPTTHSRRPSAFRPRSISAAVKGVGKKVGHVVQRLRDRSHRLGTHGRAGSLVIFMGANGQEMCNTGFAFSHDEGMSPVITPTRPPAPPREDSSDAMSPNLSNQHPRSRSVTPVQRLVGALRPGFHHHHNNHNNHHVHFNDREHGGDVMEMREDEGGSRMLGVGVAGVMVGAVGAAVAGAIRVSVGDTGKPAEGEAAGTAVSTGDVDAGNTEIGEAEEGQTTGEDVNVSVDNVPTIVGDETDLEKGHAEET